MRILGKCLTLKTRFQSFSWRCDHWRHCPQFVLCFLIQKEFKNPLALSANNQSANRSWLASFHLNNCWNPSNQASWLCWSWKASPQQAFTSFELQELQVLVRARVTLMTALPVIFLNSHQNTAVKHELFNSAEKKEVHLSTVDRKLLRFHLKRYMCVCFSSQFSGRKWELRLESRLYIFEPVQLAGELAVDKGEEVVETLWDTWGKWQRATSV